MKNTPRDFFLHVGAFAALYFAAIALITLLFDLINYTFPDAAFGYADPYSGSMRFAVASIIVLVPLFLYFMHALQREVRRDTSRQQLGIRRWLTYITLFLTGATVVGDLIALLDSFLAGTLATPFVLKAFVLLAVMGTGFWYFVLDIRGHWQKHERASKLAGAGLTVVVLISIVGAFLIMGNPMEQRALRLDQEQIDDLSTIQYQVVSYWQQNDRLPATLEMLESPVTGFRVPTAPAGRPAYSYSVDANLTFSLCATFNRASEASAYRSRAEFPGIRSDANWEHDAGRTCFARTIDPELIAPSVRLPF